MINQFLHYIELEKHYSAHTVLAYKNDLLQFCAYMGVAPELLNPTLVTESDIRNWVMDLLEQESPRSVNRKLSSLKSYWRFCIKMGITDTNILKKIISPKTKKPLPAFYKESEMNEALAYEWAGDDFESIRDNLIIRIFYETGIRRAELIGLKDSDIDMAEKTIKVLGKRNKQRIIPFGDELKQAIHIYKERRNADADVCGNTFFVRPNGQALYPKLVYNIVNKRMSEVSTLHKQSPHVLRHTFATAMLNNGADINAVKELLGHASLAATQVYTHTTFDEIHNIYKHAHPRA